MVVDGVRYRDDALAAGGGGALDDLEFLSTASPLNFERLREEKCIETESGNVEKPLANLLFTRLNVESVALEDMEPGFGVDGAVRAVGLLGTQSDCELVRRRANKRPHRDEHESSESARAAVGEAEAIGESGAAA